jgi:hypothetical protein
MTTSISTALATRRTSSIPTAYQRRIISTGVPPLLLAGSPAYACPAQTHTANPWNIHIQMQCFMNSEPKVLPMFLERQLIGDDRHRYIYNQGQPHRSEINCSSFPDACNSQVYGRTIFPIGWTALLYGQQFRIGNHRSINFIESFLSHRL